MELELITGLVPLTQFSPAVFYCSTYDHRLTINMHYDPKKISDTRAKTLLEIYCDQIKQSASI
jgi:hypothetical protein